MKWTIEQQFRLTDGDVISSATAFYEVQQILGSGTFGVVAQCRNLSTKETVAVKMLQSHHFIREAKNEESFLSMLKQLGSDRFNIIKWNSSFIYREQYCLEMEKLDISLDQYVQMSQNHHLKLKEIRLIVQQLAKATKFLKSVGIVHGDLKPDNIMVVDRRQQPVRVKIIDFGLACKSCESPTGVTLQTQWYRAPEVLLGFPFNEAIDVWSLGCIAAEMLLGKVLFPGNDEYDNMRHMVLTIGKPPGHMLDAGLYTQKFFYPGSSYVAPNHWRFLSIQEATTLACYPRTINKLTDLQMPSYDMSAVNPRAEHYDRVTFVDLVTKMLAMDDADRIKPSEILQHPFITMSHLVSSFNHTHYVQSSMELMSLYLSSQEAQDGAASTLSRHDITARPLSCNALDNHPSSAQTLAKPQAHLNLCLSNLNLHPRTKAVAKPLPRQFPTGPESKWSKNIRAIIRERNRQRARPNRPAGWTRGCLEREPL